MVARGRLTITDGRTPKGNHLASENYERLRDYVPEAAEANPAHAFPGHGQMKPEQLENDRLRREVRKLKAERDILKKAAAYFAKDQV